MKSPSPLVEPDVQISRIRLSQRLSPQACAGRPVSRAYSDTKPRRCARAAIVVLAGGRKGRWLRRRKCRVSRQHT